MGRSRLPALALLCLCLAGPAAADERAFDVPGGEVQAIYSLEFSPNHSVKCRLSISEAKPSLVWGSTLSVILSETEDVFATSDELRMVQLMLSVEAGNDRRTYYLIVHVDGESQDYDFLRVGGEDLVFGTRAFSTIARETARTCSRRGTSSIRGSNRNTPRS